MQKPDSARSASAIRSLARCCRWRRMQRRGQFDRSWTGRKVGHCIFFLDHCGDSIANSLSDTRPMMPGFVLAWRLPIWGTVTLALVFETRHGLPHPGQSDLNVIMLLRPFEFI